MSPSRSTPSGGTSARVCSRRVRHAPSPSASPTTPPSRTSGMRVPTPSASPAGSCPVSGDLRPGGRYQLQGNASGTIERCDPPRSFAATWEFGDQMSWIEVRLMARQEGRTQLVLEHIAHVDDERWAEFGPGAVGIGWDMGFMGLAIHLSSGHSMDPQEGMAWAASAEGRQFMTLASQRWCDASIAAGTDQAGARAAADRTIAAYTGTGS